MINNQRSILIFGGSDYQLSLVIECKKLNLFTVVIDPNPEAVAKDYADAFEEVGGQDFEGTCKVAEKYIVDAIITAATDKPLVMMARIAKKYNLNFFSEETATVATDKFLMKQRFAAHQINHAKGLLVTQDIAPEELLFPVILKPRDNSGSRGVILCSSRDQLKSSIAEAFKHSNKENILCEEFITGSEYSIESIHFENESHVIAITEKIKTPHPYNVELGHIQPALVSENLKDKIAEIINRIANALDFKNCASHTELIIENDEITVIESSPRLGGDFITSHLTPLSTGINIELLQIKLALGEKPNIPEKENNASGVFYLNFTPGIVEHIEVSDAIEYFEELNKLRIYLKKGDSIRHITNSLDRYGYYIIKAEDRNKLMTAKEKIEASIEIKISK